MDYSQLTNIYGEPISFLINSTTASTTDVFSNYLLGKNDFLNASNYAVAIWLFLCGLIIFFICLKIMIDFFKK